MSESTDKCGKCASEISTGATKCPSCGYEPKSENTAGRSIMMVLGLLLTGTIIGAIIGIPLLYFGYKSHQYHQDLTPTNTNPDDTTSFKQLMKY